VTGVSAGCRYQNETWKKKMSDTPNFAAWSNANLAKFALEAYLKMQEQQDYIMQLQGDFKDAMVELRKLTSNRLNVSNSIAPTLTKGGPSW
jgi:hypothetical protein